MKQKFLLKTMLLLLCMIVGVSSSWADSGTLVSALNGIEDGETYYIAALNSSKYYTVPNTTITGQTFTCAEGSLSGSTLAVVSGAGEFVFTAVSGVSNAYYIYNTNLKKYLVATASKKFGYVDSESSDYGYWTFSTVSSGGFSGLFSVQHSSKTQYMRAYNNSVRCYDGTSNNGIYLFKKQIPAHTLTYSASNGSISGVVYNTSTAVSSGSSVAESGKVTLTATPTGGYAFSGWEVSGTGSSLSSTTDNPTTFTMGTANATVTANFVAAATSDYINVSPTTKDVTSAGGDAEFTITTDQTLSEDPTQFYTTADGDVTTTKPAWITEALYDEGTLLVTVAANTGAARTAYFRVEKGGVKSSVIAINQAAITVATPEFDVAAGTYNADQLVDITCATDGATIYYTTDGSTPDNNSTEYDGNGIEITEATTLKAIAIINGVSSEVASATYTINHPLSTMDEIFAAATSAGSTATDCIITFNNWVVSGVNGSTAYVTDNNGKGFIVYKSGHGFSVGNILSGTAQASLKLYNGAAEFTTLTSSTPGLTVTTGGVLTPQVVAISDLSGVNTGALVQVQNVTYNSTDKVLIDASNGKIYPYNSLYSGMSFTGDTEYNVTGVYLQYSTKKEIMPRSAADIVEVKDPTITVASSLVVPSYEVGTATPTAGTISVAGSFLTDDITLSLGESSNFEMCLTEDGSYANSLTLTQSEGSVSATNVYVRLKAGLSKGAYEGTLTLSSTGATNQNVGLSGTVTGTTYIINVENAVTGGTIEADLTSAEEGATVTLTATPDAAYTFGSWTVYKDDMSTEVTVTDNQFTMPDCEVYVTATFTAKPTYAITCVANPVAGGTIEASPASAYEGQTVTLSYLAKTGYSLSSIVITKTSDGSATEIIPAVSGDDYTFTMPNYAVTATATFESNTFEGSFAKVTSTSALEDNAYYILYSTKAMNSAVTSGKMGATAVTIINDIIENPDKSIVWKLVKNGDNWDLYSEKEGKYCYIEGTNTSAFKMATTASYHYAVTTYTDGGFKFKTTHSSARGINYGNNDFGSYADSNSPTVYLYKYTTLTERTITFNGNGGTYNDAATYTQDVYDGVEATLDANQFTRDEYEFIGWNNQADGNGASSYGDKDAITVTGGDLTLYAKWAPLYTLTINNSIEGGSVAVVGNITSAIEGTEITLTSTPSAGHTLGAWDVYKSDDTSTKVTVTDNKFTMPAYNVIISATFEEVQTYTLLTDISQLVPGKHYIIANGTNGSVKAMGSQSTNNRTAVDVIATSGIIPETTGVYEFVIYGPDANGYYTIYDETNSKYLYAASSGSNYLKTQETNNANGKWTVEISNTGIATVKAHGSYTRNWMRNNSNIFSCYGSGQSDIYLYIKDGDTPVTTTASVTLNAYGYATFATTNTLDFLDADDADYSAWQITNVTNSAINFGQITSTVKAGTGILLKGTPNATITLNILPVGGATLGDNKLEGITTATDIAADTYFGLSGNKFVKVNAGTVKAGKALLPANEIPTTARELKFVFEDETTAIRGIENGQLRMENSFFDLQGRKIAKPTKGLYIKNGKKVVLK